MGIAVRIGCERPARAAGPRGSAFPIFVDREKERRRLEEAIRNRRSLVIRGPRGMGKAALAATVIDGLPAGLSAQCIYLHGSRDLQDLLRQLISRLYKLKDPHLRRKLHAEGVSALNFEGWLKKRSLSQLKGCLYRCIEQREYQVFLRHFPPLTTPVAKAIKELFWMRNAPVYLLVRDQPDEHFDRALKLFYWGEEDVLTLQPLPSWAAHRLLDDCIERFGLTPLDRSDFRDELLELSKRNPGAIVKMCSLAADPRYRHGGHVKLKSVYIDYLMGSLTP